ncbi:MAG: pyridoxamine 5'-phosphate oxidase family protein [Campylobacterota bacterium]|nr:pyridoxamine 5'-phosphate oxidase family protein [Campylobacterota bacterium]
MGQSLEPFEAFIAQHHILTLATCKDNTPQCATLFFVYDPDEIAFVVASDTKTEHIQNVLTNALVAGTIALETKSVGKIQGIQFQAEMRISENSIDKTRYFKAYPYALAMNPTLWKIQLVRMKLTDNRLGFGTKLIWDVSE